MSNNNTSKPIHSISGLESRTKLLIRNGKSYQQIVNSLTPLCGKDVPEKLIPQIVQDVVDDYPNYHLIQKIMRSKLVDDINSTDKLFYVVDYEKKDIITIASDKLNGLFSKTFSFSDNVYTAVQKYRPDNPVILFKNNPEDPWIFNKYIPPSWLVDSFFSKNKVEVPKVDKIPELYKKFLMHLLDNDVNSYEYVLDWLANAVQSKNYCMLCTIGARGIGKGVLGEIMCKIVGESNYHYTGNKLLKTNFNSQVQGKKIVYIDEISVTTTQEEDALKVLINDSIEIEQKGVDARYVKNYANIYISSNNLDSIKISGDNRRFSVVNLTNSKLLNVMSSDDINKLVNDENMINDFARFLYHRSVEKDKMLKVFESERTQEVRIGSLKDWEYYVVFDYALKNSGKSIRSLDVIEHIKDEKGLLRSLSVRKLNELADKFPEYMKKVQRKDIDKDSGKEIRWYEIIFLERKKDN
jgi:hypothetical protein